MNTKFHNANGLSVYALACGYIQEVDAVNDGRNIRIQMWLEHGSFHVRAHDHTVDGRLDWISEGSVADARRHFDTMIRRYYGEAITAARKDRRYTVAREYCGDKEPRWVTRFCGEWVGKAETRLAAYVVAHTHRTADAIDLAKVKAGEIVAQADKLKALAGE